MTQPIRALVLYASSSANATLAYQHGWPRHLAADPRFESTLVNVLARGGGLRAHASVRRRYDVVVALHSVFSNERHLGGLLLERIARLPAPKVVFLGNEYKLMPEKLAYCESLGVDLLVSQLDSPEAHALYRERLGCAVAAIPSAGLDVERFRPTQPLESRPIDLGYRAYANPWYLGHREREELAEIFAESGRRAGLRIDISLDPASRFDEVGWAAFLNRCKGQLGSEAGGDYFELTDTTRMSVNAFLAKSPATPFSAIREKFFDSYEHPVSGRALSGRIVEAAGTKTAQLLIEGDYGGAFQQGIHYIPLRADLSNADEALGRLLDRTEAERVADAAYEVAVTQWAYSRLLDRFHDALRPLL